jgi:hypothetical protein
MPTWPKDTMEAKIAFYGDPRGPHGVNESWFSNNVVCQVLREGAQGDGGKRAVHRGDHAISVKTIAQGRPECFR